MSSEAKWILAVYDEEWTSYRPEEKDLALRAFESKRVSRILFDPTGAPFKLMSGDAREMAIILRRKRYGNGTDPDLEDARRMIRDGDEPNVSPSRALFKQWALKRAMEVTFNRKTVEFFGASPLRRTSLSYFDVSRFPAVKGFVALSLDDAPCRFGKSNSRLQDVRKLLSDYSASATFMVIGKFVPGHEDDLVALLKEGHELANHGMVDRPYHKDCKKDFEAAVAECNELIYNLQRLAQVEAKVRWFRAPHGKYSDDMEAVLQGKNLTNTMCDTYASCPIVEDGEWIGRFLSRQADHGSIILLHMPETCFREHCFVALALLLDGLRARGLRALSVDKLARLASSSSSEGDCLKLARNANCCPCDCTAGFYGNVFGTPKN